MHEGTGEYYLSSFNTMIPSSTTTIFKYKYKNTRDQVKEWEVDLRNREIPQYMRVIIISKAARVRSGCPMPVYACGAKNYAYNNG